MFDERGTSGRWGSGAPEGEPLFSRRCPSENEARCVAHGLKQDELKTALLAMTAATTLVSLFCGDLCEIVREVPRLRHRARVGSAWQALASGYFGGSGRNRCCHAQTPCSSDRNRCCQDRTLCGSDRNRCCQDRTLCRSDRNRRCPDQTQQRGSARGAQT